MQERVKIFRHILCLVPSILAAAPRGYLLLSVLVEIVCKSALVHIFFRNILLLLRAHCTRSSYFCLLKQSAPVSAISYTNGTSASRRAVSGLFSALIYKKRCNDCWRGAVKRERYSQTFTSPGEELSAIRCVGLGSPNRAFHSIFDHIAILSAQAHLLP